MFPSIAKRSRTTSRRSLLSAPVTPLSKRKRLQEIHESEEQESLRWHATLRGVGMQNIPASDLKVIAYEIMATIMLCTCDALERQRMAGRMDTLERARESEIAYQDSNPPLCSFVTRLECKKSLATRAHASLGRRLSVRRVSRSRAVGVLLRKARLSLRAKRNPLEQYDYKREDRKRHTMRIQSRTSGAASEDSLVTNIEALDEQIHLVLDLFTRAHDQIATICLHLPRLGKPGYSREEHGGNSERIKDSMPPASLRTESLDAGPVATMIRA